MPRKATNSKVKDKKTSLVEQSVDSRQSKISMILGALIVIIIGVLVFNYFNRNNASLGPAQQAKIETKDVSPDKLPGKYTVKDGDTLFTIADNYYKDGFKYTEIAKANNLDNPDQLETGKVLEIPKLKTQQAQASPQPSALPQEESLGTGGGNSTIWGPRIEEDKYTVQSGDWLSTIAGRAYGDIFAFEKIAKANNISNPDQIEPGTVLTIPR